MTRRSRKIGRVSIFGQPLPPRGFVSQGERIVSHLSGRRPIKQIAAVLVLFVSLRCLATGPLYADDALVGSTLASSGDSTDPLPHQRQVAALIEQLGSNRYVERRAAEQALLDRGMQVFDQVDAATTSLDPEVATSCKYLLSQLTISWAHRDDPPAVKNYLSRYGSLEEQQRIAQANRLSQLPDGEGVAALVRIVRYDTSPAVSAYAAMYLLRRDSLSTDWDNKLATVLRCEVGASVRPTADWVRALAVQIETPGNAIAAWQPIVDEYRKMVDDTAYDEVKQQQYATLLWNLFRVGVQQADWSAANDAIDELVAAIPAEVHQTLIVAMNTAVEKQAWPLLDHVLAEHGDEIEGAKEPLYFAAHARDEQGQGEAAEELANLALAAPDGQTSSSIPSDAMRIAYRLNHQDHVKWARREYEAAIESAPDGSATQAFACWWLADSHHDWQEDKKAAEVIGKLAEVLRNNTQASGEYRRLQSRRMFGGSTATLPTVDSIFAKEHYFLGLHYMQAGDRELAWKHFKQACDHDEGDSDTLIGMYRVSEPDSSERKMTLAKIDQLSQVLLRQIDDDPDDPIAYNHWAWLIGNTVGDYEKAVRFSHKSLEISPDTAGFLDTLGRCYFSAGDIENAVKYQRRAVELDPSTRILKRQLEEFESALAKQPSATDDSEA